jgi:hypothetical protein
MFVFDIYQDGIQPMWEDASNKNGGRWLVNLNKNQRQTELDNFWLETVSTESIECSSKWQCPVRVYYFLFNSK